MKILIIGEQENFDEFKLKFGDLHSYTLSDNLASELEIMDDQDLIFDFSIDDYPDNVEVYATLDMPIFLNSIKTTLAELNYISGLSSNIYGFNGVKTMLNRPYLEVTTMDQPDETLKGIFTKLDAEYLIVDDRVGMVTPRVIFMIINEAFYTVQEGTATKDAIDQGMKLGTNYPHGPFEWMEKIGIKDVYETLEVIYEDTKEERYKICPMLKKEYLAVTG